MAIVAVQKKSSISFSPESIPGSAVEDVSDLIDIPLEEEEIEGDGSADPSSSPNPLASRIVIPSASSSSFSSSAANTSTAVAAFVRKTSAPSTLPLAASSSSSSAFAHSSSPQASAPSAPIFSHSASSSSSSSSSKPLPIPSAPLLNETASTSDSPPLAASSASALSLPKDTSWCTPVSPQVEFDSLEESALSLFVSSQVILMEELGETGRLRAISLLENALHSETVSPALQKRIKLRLWNNNSPVEIGWLLDAADGYLVKAVLEPELEDLRNRAKTYFTRQKEQIPMVYCCDILEDKLLKILNQLKNDYEDILNIEKFFEMVTESFNHLTHYSQTTLLDFFSLRPGKLGEWLPSVERAHNLLYSFKLKHNPGFKTENLLSYFAEKNRGKLVQSIEILLARSETMSRQRLLSQLKSLRKAINYLTDPKFAPSSNTIKEEIVQYFTSYLESFAKRIEDASQSEKTAENIKLHYLLYLLLPDDCHLSSTLWKNRSARTQISFCLLEICSYDSALWQSVRHREEIFSTIFAEAQRDPAIFASQKQAWEKSQVFADLLQVMTNHYARKNEAHVPHALLETLFVTHSFDLKAIASNLPPSEDPSIDLRRGVLSQSLSKAWDSQDVQGALKIFYSFLRTEPS